MIFDSTTAPLRFAAKPSAILHYLDRIRLLMLVPLAVAFFLRQQRCRPALRAGLRASVAGRRSARGTEDRSALQQNEALCIFALSFVVSSFAVAIPLTGYGLSPLDAWFDAISGVTITGLSTLPSFENMPFSFHFGRSWAQWVGGQGIMVLTLAVMLKPGTAAYHLGRGYAPIFRL